jgi:hypothetical protein
MFMNSTTRPANPADISFAADCFVQDGVRVTFECATPKGAIGGKKFSNESDAQAWERKTGQHYTRVEHPVMRRVRWN